MGSSLPFRETGRKNGYRTVMREHNPVGQGMELAMQSNWSVVNKGVTWSHSGFVLKVELARFTDRLLPKK